MSMVRVVLLLLATLAFGWSAHDALAGRRVIRDAPGIDRPGGDYAHNTLVQPDPELCVRQCALDGRCSAFTYVRPGVQGPQAMCWLKSRTPPQVRSTCCQSGRMSYVADGHPTRPAEIQPPPTLNNQWCTMGLICASGKKGSWIDERRTCACDPP